MDPQVTAAVITAAGSCVAAFVVLVGGWGVLARELRYRRRSDQERELFERALNDCVDFLREIKAVSHALGVVAYDLVQNRQDAGLSLVRRVDDIMVGLGRAGWLAPPELAGPRDVATKLVRDLRAAILEGVNDERVMHRYNSIIRDVNEATQAFIREFEAWKGRHWEGTAA
jgi:hypothetical protein